jgi:quercetin dioxygenase-like cupin family protein
MPFKEKDVLFVPAGVEHRFDNFTDDFMTWVIFYGQKGGKKLWKKNSTNL